MFRIVTPCTTAMTTEPIGIAVATGLKAGPGSREGSTAAPSEIVVVKP